MASSDSWPGGLGVRPRPMVFSRWLQIVLGGGCSLRSVSKLHSDGVPAGHGFEEIDSGGGCCSTMAESGAQRFQGPSCIFSFFCGPLCNLFGGVGVLCILPKCIYICTVTCTVSFSLILVPFDQKKIPLTHSVPSRPHQHRASHWRR